MIEASSAADSGAPKILLLVTGLGVGGAERVVLELASKMPERYKISLLALDGNRDLLNQYPKVNFELLSLGIQRSNKLSFSIGLIRFFKFFLKGEFDIVHAHMFHALVFACLCKIIKPSTKIVFTSHSFGGFDGIRKAFVKLTRHLRAADVIFAKNQHAEMNAGNVFVIPNGVNVQSSYAHRSIDLEKSFVFLHLGRLEPVKNTVYLVEAFASMKNRRCELWFAGDGSVRSTLEKVIVDRSLESRVFVMGVQSDVRNLLARADCVVLASLWEGLPMALLEAGAQAMPVIAPPVGAIPPLLSDECGYLAAHEDLACKMDFVIDNSLDALRRGLKLKEKIFREYSIDRMAARHDILYKNISQ